MFDVTITTIERKGMMEATEIYAIGQELKTLNDQELAFIKGFISGIQATDKTEDKEESNDDSTN